jgi:hypothetical protein
MPGDDENLESCADCGATVYPEHLAKRMAERWDGRLLCVHCLKDRKAGTASGVAVVTSPSASGSIPVVDLDSGPGGSAVGLEIEYEKKPSVTRSYGVPGKLEGFIGAGKSLRRPINPESPMATRCKTFHCKLADGPMSHMNEQINEWADSDDNILIKFATSTIGVVEGKHNDPHLIVTVFY